MAAPAAGRAGRAGPAPSPRLAPRVTKRPTSASSASRARAVRGRARRAPAPSSGDADARPRADGDDADHGTRRAFLVAAASLGAPACSSALASLFSAPTAWASSALAPPSAGSSPSPSLPSQLASALAPAGDALAPPARVTLPMAFSGGTYVVSYRIGATPVRGVVDTGSPFVTMEERCGAFWGCLVEGDARPSGLTETYEVYGLQEDGVTKWVLGDLTFEEEAARSDSAGAIPRGAIPEDRRGGVEEAVVASSVSSATSGDDIIPLGRFFFPEVLFGLTSDTRPRGSAAGGGTGNAPFLGLVKGRQDWIRPTFLGQTDVASFSLDFSRDALTLSRERLIPLDERRGVLALADLRPLGSPVYHYAVEAKELWINGGRYRDKRKRPVYVVFDSGTTGCLVSRELFESSDFSLGTFECHARFEDEAGARVSIGTSLRECAGRCLFLPLPVDVPWEGVPRDAHVIFAGLAFMFNKGSLTVDADDGRLRLGDGPGPAEA